MRLLSLYDHLDDVFVVRVSYRSHGLHMRTVLRNLCTPHQKLHTYWPTVLTVTVMAQVVSVVCLCVCLSVTYVLWLNGTGRRIDSISLR